MTSKHRYSANFSFFFASSAIFRRERTKRRWTQGMCCLYSEALECLLRFWGWGEGEEVCIRSSVGHDGCLLDHLLKLRLSNAPAVHIHCSCIKGTWLTRLTKGEWSTLDKGKKKEVKRSLMREPIKIYSLIREVVGLLGEST